MPKRSLPASNVGMARAWMGVGVVYFSEASARNSGSQSPRDAKVVFVTKIILSQRVLSARA
jgi:hypothetical protein